MHNKQEHLPYLTGLRFIAAFMVFVHHFPLPEERVGKFLYAFQSELYIGVTVFFVLSGFLITYRYHEKPIIWKTYLANRFARIYPMYLLFTLGAFFIGTKFPHIIDSYKITEGNFITSLFLNLTLTKAFFSNYIFTGLAQGWTLTLEECFYLSAPILFIFLRKKKWWQLIATLYSLGIACVLIGKILTWGGFFKDWMYLCTSTFFGRCFDFLAGMYLCVLYLNRKKLAPKYFPWFTLLGNLSIGIAVTLLVLVRSNDSLYPFALFTWPGVGINNILVPLAVALLMWGLLTEKSWLQQLLATSIFDILGKSSYVFYLIHMGWLSSLLLMVTKRYYLHLPALILLSIGLYYLIEKPANRWIRQQFNANTR
ncbi:MAG: acyltransferase family protein [Chitinophagaceae bacterium]